MPFLLTDCSVHIFIVGRFYSELRAPKAATHEPPSQNTSKTRMAEQPTRYRGRTLRQQLNLFKIFKIVEDPDLELTGAWFFSFLHQSQFLGVRFVVLRRCAGLIQTGVYLVALAALAVTIITIYSTRDTTAVQQQTNPTYAHYLDIIGIDPNPNCACANTGFPLKSFTTTNYTLDFFCEFTKRVNKLCKLQPAACSAFAGNSFTTSTFSGLEVYYQCMRVLYLFYLTHFLQR